MWIFLNLRTGEIFLNIRTRVNFSFLNSLSTDYLRTREYFFVLTISARVNIFNNLRTREYFSISARVSQSPHACKFLIPLQSRHVNISQQSHMWIFLSNLGTWMSLELLCFNYLCTCEYFSTTSTRVSISQQSLHEWIFLNSLRTREYFSTTSARVNISRQ